MQDAGTSFSWWYPSHTDDAAPALGDGDDAPGAAQLCPVQAEQTFTSPAVPG